jgi:hypothetical protein
MRLEHERFPGSGPYERSPERRGYANGYKPKRLDTTVDAGESWPIRILGAAGQFCWWI